MTMGLMGQGSQGKAEKRVGVEPWDSQVFRNLQEEPTNPTEGISSRYPVQSAGYQGSDSEA